MTKWIDEIAYDFVCDLFKKSKKESNLGKATEVHKYIASLSPIELSKVMDIGYFDKDIAWRYAEQYAYRLVWKFTVEI